MFKRFFYMAVGALFLVSCASQYEAEKAVTRAEVSDSQQQQSKMASDFSGDLRSVYFETGKSELTARFKNRLDRNIDILKNNPQFNVYVKGHADRRGAESMNWELAMKRAKAVEDYLVQQGVSRDRVYTISKGEADPKVTAADESYFQINRRVDFEPFKSTSELAE
ncbi:MAG: OmpA family protein [Bacteriovoracaceae bacterium]|nr:OmpA family protein [Bacteriovoracaceae bacterium]